jgi:ribosomal protein S18 acetylase RimI-like enzyme
MGALLHACVLDGASIGFITPFTPAEAETFWSAKILPAMRRGGLLVLAAKVDGALAGTVQLDHDTPANQPHRAEVRKMLVHPRFRRRGVARALMRTLENHARDLGRTLLTLDTRTGDAAEPLYASLGFETTGVVPGFCRDTLTTRLDSATLMYKRL